VDPDEGEAMSNPVRKEVDAFDDWDTVLEPPTLAIKPPRQVQSLAFIDHGAERFTATTNVTRHVDGEIVRKSQEGT
jgi:hypothetical protein